MIYYRYGLTPVHDSVIQPDGRNLVDIPDNVPFLVSSAYEPVVFLGTYLTAYPAKAGCQNVRKLGTLISSRTVRFHRFG
jgi:hypothetical protein